MYITLLAVVCCYFSVHAEYLGHLGELKQTNYFYRISFAKLYV